MLKPLTRQDIARARSILWPMPAQKPKPFRLMMHKLQDGSNAYCSWPMLRTHEDIRYRDASELASRPDLPKPLLVALFSRRTPNKLFYVTQRERDAIFSHFQIPDELAATAFFHDANPNFSTRPTLLDITPESFVDPVWLKAQRAWAYGTGQMPALSFFSWGKYSEGVSFPGRTVLLPVSFPDGASNINAWQLVELNGEKRAIYWYTVEKKQSARHAAFRFVNDSLERIEEYVPNRKNRQAKTTFNPLEFKKFLASELRRPTGRVHGFSRAHTRDGRNFEFYYLSARIEVNLPEGIRVEDDELLYFEFIAEKGRRIKVLCYKNEEKKELIGSGNVLYNDWKDKFVINLTSPPSLAQLQDQPSLAQAAS